ncbi:myocyte-specific enhancer factor 2C-like isoform X2 [Tachypleus tridentatus]|uniref:myocyte-specific enhancer factor 2C-like isoform X2 n=1 Tax=Tachypleus tridentatus TaxID=6853 RepID=UPI003FD0FF44
MGRKKIQISRITDERNRQVTFTKRKFGLMKKAYELSVLCDCEIALIIFNGTNKLFQYASTDMDKVLLKYTEYNEPHESRTNSDIIDALSKKDHKSGGIECESPEPDSDQYSLTPRSEDKFSKINEEFERMIQKNSGQLNENRPTQSSTLNQHLASVPATMSVSTSPYSAQENTLMQPSPHSRISPCPSSSVFFSGALLDVNGGTTNGYHRSVSPHVVSGSSSPGLATNKQGNFNKQLSPPGAGSIQRPNLRVVIPNPHTSPVSLSTRTLSNPVVSMTTPGILGMANYPSNLTSTFQQNDFQLNPELGLTGFSPTSLLSSWSSTQGSLAAAMSHNSSNTTSGANMLPHLSVSNSTPSPSTSPLPVKVKNEPVSPSRDVSVHRPSSVPGHLSFGHQLSQSTRSSPDPDSIGDYNSPLNKRPRVSVESWGTS